MSDVIATVWDFDKTLIPGYMQEPIFNHFHYDGATFWKENNSEIEQYEAKGLTVNHDTYYLNKFIRMSQQGAPFDGLNNQMLETLGAELTFCPGAIWTPSRTIPLGRSGSKEKSSATSGIVAARSSKSIAC